MGLPGQENTDSYLSIYLAFQSILPQVGDIWLVRAEDFVPSKISSMKVVRIFFFRIKRYDMYIKEIGNDGDF